MQTEKEELANVVTSLSLPFNVQAEPLGDLNKISRFVNVLHSHSIETLKRQASPFLFSFFSIQVVK